MYVFGEWVTGMNLGFTILEEHGKVGSSVFGCW